MQGQGGPVTPGMTSAQAVMRAARSWLGLDFKPGQTEQCAAFVRAVFGEAGVPLAVASRPSDWALTADLEQGPEYANSFFGDEVGRRVAWEQACPGDLLAFRDTYEGDFPPGCITHVGICAGEGRMIDRSTKGRPVREIPIEDWWREHLVEIRRPHALTNSSTEDKLGVSAKDQAPADDRPLKNRPPSAQSER